MSIRLGGIRASWAIETDSGLPLSWCNCRYDAALRTCASGHAWEAIQFGNWIVSIFWDSSLADLFLVNDFKWKKENEETMNASMLMFCKHTDVGGCKMQGIVLAAWRYFMNDFYDLLTELLCSLGSATTQAALLLLDAMHEEDAEEPNSLSWTAAVNACSLTCHRIQEGFAVFVMWSMKISRLAGCLYDFSWSLTSHIPNWHHANCTCIP